MAEHVSESNQVLGRKSSLTIDPLVSELEFGLVECDFNRKKIALLDIITPADSGWYSQIQRVGARMPPGSDDLFLCHHHVDSEMYIRSFVYIMYRKLEMMRPPLNAQIDLWGSDEARAIRCEASSVEEEG